MRHWLEGMSGLAPGVQSANDDESLESMFLKYLRHPGTRGFALSSTVEINLPIVREILDLFLQIVGFQANRSGDSLRMSIVISVAADVGDNDVRGLLRRQSPGESLDRYAGDDVE